MSLSLVARRARLLALRDLADADGGGAFQLRDGSMPSAPEDAAFEPPLAIVALAVPSFELAPGIASMTATAQGFAAISGQATWARLVDGAGSAVQDFTAGPPGSGAQVIVTDNKIPPSAVFFVGGEVNLSLTLLEP
jgi:hypothetical protein